MKNQSDVRSMLDNLITELEGIRLDSLDAIHDDLSDESEWSEIYEQLECQSGTITTIMGLFPDDHK